MNKRAMILAALLALPLTTLAATEADYQKAYEEAEAAFQKVQEEGRAWLHTRPMLDDAKAAAATGDFDRAVSLAETAKLQSELALEQTRYQQEHWQDNIPYER